MLRLYFVLLLVGCGASRLATLSAGRVGCPADEVEVFDENRGLRMTSWTATCRGTRFQCVQERATDATGTAQPSNVECTEERGMTTAGGVVPATWDVNRIRVAYSAAQPNIASCFAVPPNELVLFVVLDANGRLVEIGYQTAVGERSESCIRSALNAVNFYGRVEASRTKVWLRFTSRGVEARLDTATPATSSGTATAQPARPPVATASPAAASREDAVRTLLDARRSLIVSCNGGAPLAVQASWEADGAVTLALPGGSNDTVEGCVRAAGRGLSVGSGTPGSILHPLASD